MPKTLTKLSIGILTTISAGAYVPVVPSELAPGLSGLPDMVAYQYEAGSDRTDWRLEGSTLVNYGQLPDADFKDEDGNGLISVGVFTNKKGEDIYKKITDAEYALLGTRGGYAHNPKKSELVSLLDAIAPKAEASIAVDATSQGYANSTSLTFAHTSTGSDLILMVQLWTFPSGDTVSGITYNGTALTKKGTRSADAGGYTNQWSLVAPSTGANNIVISMSSSQVFATAVTYTGVDQTTPHPDATVTGTQTGTTGLSASMTTTVDQSWLVMAGRSPSRVPTAGANTLLRKTNGTSGDAGWTLDSDGGRSTGSNALNWSYSPSATTYYVMSVIAPSAGASTPVAIPEDVMKYE